MKLKAMLLMMLAGILTIPLFSQQVKLSYNGSVLYPGAKVGYESVYRTKNVEKEKKSGKIKRYTRESLWSANVGYYHHQGFHDNLYLTLGWTKRRTFSKGFFLEFSPEAGICRTFLGGTTYRVGNDGKITVVSSSGYFYPLLSIGGGLGYDFSIRNPQKPLMAFCKLNALAIYPYNSAVYLRPTFEIGLTYKLKPSNR